MRKPTEQERLAFNRIKRTADGLLLRLYLEDCLSEQDKANRYSDIGNVQKGQGKSLVIAEMIETIERE
mgnify:CR=1